MKGKTEQLVSPFKHHHQVDKDDSYGKSLSAVTGNVSSNSKRLNNSWNMGSLMAELPLSPSSIHSYGDSPNHPRHSFRPSTVFYSPRYQDIKASTNYSDLKKQLPNCKNLSSSYDSSKNFGFLGGIQSNEYEASIDFDDYKYPVSAAVPDKRGITPPGCDEFGEAIPVIDEESSEQQLQRRLKPYQDFLDEVQNIKLTEFDAMKKATYTHLLRKLTKKEEAIDEWELKRRTKLELQLDKLERKLEQRRAEAVQKVNKKLAETKMEAQKRKAKARRLALKEMAKHCSQIN
ncbi:Remorin 4.1 [Bienertia sinuspersici]